MKQNFIMYVYKLKSEQGVIFICALGQNICAVYGEHTHPYYTLLSTKVFNGLRMGTTQNSYTHVSAYASVI